MWAAIASLALLAHVGGAPPPQFPPRFSAAVKWRCPGDVGCGGVGPVRRVHQDLAGGSSLIAGRRGGEPWGAGYVYNNVLVTRSSQVGAGSVAFTWKTGTANTRCSRGRASPPGAFFPQAVSVFEAKETVNGVLCERWSNGVVAGSAPYPDLWAVWFVADPPGGTATVAQVSYTQQTDPMHGFPIPGWTYFYEFTNFTTSPIPSSTFDPPPDWQSACPAPPPPTPPPPTPRPPPPTPRTCHCFKCGDSVAKTFPAGTKCAPERWDCGGESAPGKGCFNVECDPDGNGVADGVCACGGPGGGTCVKSASWQRRND